ncbi:membrane protein [Candidatus Megaera polyxenophila]|uniref:TolC family outer membrane protein n=1 Tax=Candidatus Megaera polyxenophila TaxID=988779 RepID=UPI00249EE5D3|nr:TolC family outer membrane protein [Candidatus Megaera polyxenophila]BBB57472.1 membrane protein [Candidatus Megaera polyxenophila]
MYRLVLFTFITLNFSNSLALELNEALKSGYNNDEKLKIIRSDFLNEIEQFPRALAGFMPKISAGFDATDSKVTRKSNIAAGLDNTSTDNSRYSKTLTLDQSIFNGGSSVAELKAAQSAFRASKGDYYAKEQNIFLEEITNYLNCVEATEKYNISKISVKSNRTQLEAVKEKFKLGESTETEVASAESGLATAQANQSIAYANFEAAKAEFLRVFALEATGIKMPELAANLPNSLEELVEIAIAANPNIISSQHSTKASKAGEYAAKGALLPQVSFRIQSGDTRYSPEDQLRQNFNSNSVTSTLSVNVPILSKGGVEYSDIRRAKYKTRKAVLQLDTQIKQIKSQCKASWEKFNAAKTRIAATSQGVKSGEIAYEGMLQEEMLGSKTIIDVIMSEEKLSKAREARVEAQRELILASYNIKSLMGELTAEKMKLPVEYFNPDQEFKKLKLRIVGF